MSVNQKTTSNIHQANCYLTLTSFSLASFPVTFRTFFLCNWSVIPYNNNVCQESLNQIVINIEYICPSDRYVIYMSLTYFHALLIRFIAKTEYRMEECVIQDHIDNNWTLRAENSPPMGLQQREKSFCSTPLHLTIDIIVQQYLESFSI